MSGPTLIVGAGLAGAALAWELHRRGEDFQLIDRGDAVTASTVAAGLLTPLTGKKLAKSAGWDAAFPEAAAHYRAAEAATGRAFFTPAETVRIFASAAEADDVTRRAPTQFGDLPRPTNPPLDPAHFAAPFGSLTMPSARLDAPGYLAASRGYFTRLGRYQTCEFTLADLRDWGRVVLCQGFAAAAAGLGPGSAPAFPVRFHPSHGDVLTVALADVTESRTLNRAGTWLFPLTDAQDMRLGTREMRTKTLYRCGSTYTPTHRDPTPTAAGRDRILANLRAFVRVPAEVLDHAGAVRPIIRTSHPVVGTHPAEPRLAFFNGLGSKGALMAPAFARRFADYLFGGAPLDPADDVTPLLDPTSES